MAGADGLTQVYADVLWQLAGRSGLQGPLLQRRHGVTGFRV